MSWSSLLPHFHNKCSLTPDVWMSSRPLPSLWESHNEIILHEQFLMQSGTIIRSCVLQKAWKALFALLAWVTAQRRVSSDERRRVSLHRIWLTLSDSSVPGQFRHTDIKHIKCLSQHFTWHCSSTLICYPWRGGFCHCFKSGFRIV